MVRLREIPCTATFAWSPSARDTSIVTGTKAGAVDADFSTETKLELWDLKLDEQQQELAPVASVPVDSRFHDVAWGTAYKDYNEGKDGIIAGALENGALELWDASKLREDASSAHITRITKHTGPIKAVQFNGFRSELLASAGAKGELYVHDLEKADKTFRLGTAVARADDFDCLDWNKKVAHILVTGSSGGFATVWDAKAKKESLTLNNLGRKAVSAIAWDPDNSTKLATATSSDQEPVVLIWDLRNSNAPERVIRGHEQGILSLAWSQHDPKLLLSCGKDNRTICWNAHTGESFGELPIVTNWTFETRWNPRQPSLFATGSFDGKIGVQTVQSTNKDVSQPSAAPTLTDADFFANAGAQPSGDTFSLKEAPQWLKKPVSAAFGFGGKLVKISTTQGDAKASSISITTFVADSSVGQAAEDFEDVLKGGDYTTFCKAKIADSQSEDDKANWTVIETLISGSRSGLREYLGFSPAKPEANGEVKEKQSNGEIEDDAAFFGGGDDAEDNFLSTLASSKGVKTNNPFKLYSGSESDADKTITRALMLGLFDQAVDVCLKENRLSDAFMIASCGGQKCIDKVQTAYFKRQGDGPNYLRLLASVVGKNLWDVVYNADLSNWREVLATICTFADEKEFPDLCEALGDRLEENLEGSDSLIARKDASFCYLAGSKLEKVVGIWMQELKEHESEALKANEADSAYSVHAKALQAFIEKVTIFREVSKFKDSDAAKSSGWKLETLYSKYTEYADILASNGKVALSSRFLDLVPEAYGAAAAAKGRVRAVGQKVPVAAAQRPVTATTARGQRVVPTYGAAPAAVVPPSNAAGNPYAPQAFNAAPNPLQPAQSAYQPLAAQGGYAPGPGIQPLSNPYAPQGYQPTPTPYGGGYAPPSSVVPPPPPRVGTASPGLAPAAANKNLASWNDTPDFFASNPVQRRGTPAARGAITSPFANQPVGGPPPPIQTFSPPAPAPVAPPPKAGAPRVMSPPAAAGQPPIPRPNSSAANLYAPQQPLQPLTNVPPASQVPSHPRGASPYNLPPAGAPAASRYAPAPGTQPSPAPGYGGGPPPGPRQIAPPPGKAAYAPPNHFDQPSLARPTPPPAAVGSTAPPPPPPKGLASGPPPPGPARMNHKATTSVNQLPPPQRSESRGASSGIPDSANPPEPKYPIGDRSHIPLQAQPIFQILSTEIARIKQKAPAQFRPQVLDTEKRLNILFDHLNNEDLLKADTVAEVAEVAQALGARDFESATSRFQEVMVSKVDEGSQWMVGVKRLIQMSRATPL